MNCSFRPYAFRNREFPANRRLVPTPNAQEKAACLFSDEWEILLPATDSRLAKFYAQDLFSFFFDSFGICPRVRFAERGADAFKDRTNKIVLLTEEDQESICLSSDAPAAFYIEVTEDSVLIVGKSERGAAQGVYFLEDEMRLRGEAAMPLVCTERAPLFSPRMTHSGLELDVFSDAFLAAAAHAGMDAVIVYAGHPDMNLRGFEDPDALWPGTGRGYCDFADLVYRAAGYGLDVYIYSQIKCDMHPDEEGAAEYYEKSFGAIFKKCPDLKGIIFVGESFEFPSKDPHTAGVRCQLKLQGETRPSPGFYPSSDYPALLSLVRDTVRAYNPHADIVFWTYNWGWADRQARLSLIETLPRDISLLVTFEMWECLTDTNGDAYHIADYSVSFPGPARVFLDEAEKRRSAVFGSTQ